MNRRGFFKLLGTGAGVVAAAPLVRTWPFRTYSFAPVNTRVEDSPVNTRVEDRFQISGSSIGGHMDCCFKDQDDIFSEPPKVLQFTPNTEQAKAYEKLFAGLKRQDHEARSKEIKDLYLSRNKFKVTEVNQDEKSITLVARTPADNLFEQCTRSVDDLYTEVFGQRDDRQRPDNPLDLRFGIRSGRRNDDRHI